MVAMERADGFAWMKVHSPVTRVNTITLRQDPTQLSLLLAKLNLRSLPSTLLDAITRPITHDSDRSSQNALCTLHLFRDRDSLHQPGSSSMYQK